ncbi:hypothetical protein CZ774_07210 [Frigoribacterium sp. JB110]|nr:hypothetical protein CZ774_07210 [Frigoribacterium sp. JB110]
MLEGAEQTPASDIQCHLIPIPTAEPAKRTNEPARVASNRMSHAATGE